MDFRFDDWFPKEPNVSSETLIHDVMIGDQTLFMRADMVEQGWRMCSRCLTLGRPKTRTCPTTPPATMEQQRTNCLRAMTNGFGGP
jgi:glucose-6-phosphate 1-dehydrogenase